MDHKIEFSSLAARFDHPVAAAVVLMGSHARGTPGPYSDVDLVRFTKDDHAKLPGNGSHLIDGSLVVVSDVTPTQVEDAFKQPELVVETIRGLRSGRSLIDRDSFFIALQQRAVDFQWDNEMQAKANRWASREMVGLIEEVHKGLEGLRSGHIGRLLHARWGCTWGLTRLMCVQRGILLSGDNALFEEVTADIGLDTEWTQLCRAVWGLGTTPATIHDEVKAGLQLYGLTAAMLDNILLPEDHPLVANTLILINSTLS